MIANIRTAAKEKSAEGLGAGALSIGPFHLELSTGRLSRDGQEVQLRPRAFRLLHVLARNSGRPVSHDEIARTAWDGEAASKHNIAVTIAEVRKALKECGSWISSHARQGYCLESPQSESALRLARHYRTQFTPTGFEYALDALMQASESDAANARIWNEIVLCHLDMAATHIRSPRATRSRFEDAFNRAVSLQGMTPELRRDRAFGLLVFEGRFTEAIQELLKVKRAHPELPEVRSRLALSQLILGQTSRAQEEMRHVPEVDLLAPTFAIVSTLLPLFRREYGAAEAAAKKVMALHPGSASGRLLFAQALEYNGALEQAFEQYEIAYVASPTPRIRSEKARCLARLGRTDEARTHLAALLKSRETEYVDAYAMALVFDALGRKEEAFEELERAYEEGSNLLYWLDVDPKADSLKSDPRFLILREKVFRYTMAS